MIRLTHRRCRHETEGLAEAARHQTERAEELADDLRATQHGLAEVVDACESAEYAATEADIPEVLRERLAEADRLAREHADQKEALLVTAHEAGTLARTYALMEGAGMGTVEGLAAWLLRVNRIGWVDLPGWGCQDATCSRPRRELVWHRDAPDQAHLACDCGRVWPALSTTVARAERETREHQRAGTHIPSQRRWSQTPTPVLEAVDRALPAPATVGRQRAAAA